MEIIIGLIIVAAVAYLGYMYVTRNKVTTNASVEVTVPDTVIENAPPAVSHVSEMESVEVQNSEEPTVAPAKTAKGKNAAKTTKAAKPAKTPRAKKPKLEIAK